MTREEILELPVMRHDLGSEISMRYFFERLFCDLWKKEANFDSKRPWGNSGWKWDIYVTLIKHNVIPGKLDEYGYVEEVDSKSASDFVENEILYPFFS